MPVLRTALGLVALLAAGAGCAHKPPPTQPPGAPPTPTSITRKQPGGDAADPERAALERLASEPWGFRRDRYRTLRVPLADWKNWRRVIVWGHKTRATYRYGDDHYAVVTIRYTPIDGANDPASCLEQFMKYASPVAEAANVSLRESRLVQTTQQVGDERRPILVKILDGSIDTMLKSDDYSGAVAVYQSWPGTCLVQGFAVVAGSHRELAARVRDRWIAEGAPALLWEATVKAAPETLMK